MLFILADNQDITRWGIYTFIRRQWKEAQFKEAYTLKNISDILSDAYSLEKNIIVILDYTLMNCSEDELLVVSTRYPDTQFLLFSEQLSKDFIRRMIYNNSSFSILLKDSSLDELQTCLENVSQNRQYICQRVFNWIEKEEKGNLEKSSLTTTEREILKALSLGKTTKDIAAERFLSVYTVMTHRKNIFRKLGVNNIQEAIRYALRIGIVDPVDYYI